VLSTHNSVWISYLPLRGLLGFFRTDVHFRPAQLFTIPDPVLVNVQDTSGTPMQGLPVYVFDDTTYIGKHATTDENGEAVFRLLEGSYRFRTDFNPCRGEKPRPCRLSIKREVGKARNFKMVMIISVVKRQGV